MNRWLDRAVCTSDPPGQLLDVFFEPEHEDRARALCEVCPVAGECLADAIEANDTEFGFRAGMTPQERKRFKKDRLAA